MNPEWETENTVETDYNKDGIQVTQLIGEKPKYLSNHAKLKLMDVQGKKITVVRYLLQFFERD